MKVEIDKDLEAFIRRMATNNGVSIRAYTNNLVEMGRNEELNAAKRRESESEPCTS